ncbi:metal-sensitive transcriptional regulator [Paenibacillus campi]|uniref:metal-sensitive transcriptional regulator n=1 Tax=Paenibacillus campi TaxID=3106031 RepID=UPI002AFFD839|nr:MULTISPECIES: metal-sensitive transcriptional regulator [unclassified Paenibacillus]
MENINVSEQQPLALNLPSAGEAETCGICNHSGRHSHHADEMKHNLVRRLNRVEGQIRGIKGMIEKDTYCDDVLNQIAAAQSALNSVGRLLLEGHMKSCVVERIEAGEHEVIDELLVTINKLLK